MSRRGFVGVRLSPDGRSAVQAIADGEHNGNLSEAIRALLAEALSNRQRTETRNPLLAGGPPEAERVRSPTPTERSTT